MSDETEVVWLDEQREISLRELLDIFGLREAELLELVHSGAMPASETVAAATVQRARDHGGPHRLPLAQ